MTTAPVLAPPAGYFTNQAEPEPVRRTVTAKPVPAGLVPPIDHDEADLKRMTPIERATLAAWCRWPWSWMLSDDAYNRLFERYALAGIRRYWAVLGRTIPKPEKDWRVWNGHSWIRASLGQWEQAAQVGMPRRIEGEYDDRQSSPDRGTVLELVSKAELLAVTA